MPEAQSQPDRNGARRRSPLDLVVVAALLAGLAAVTILAGRSRPSTGPAAAAAGAPLDDVERRVLPEQVGYREGVALHFEEKVRAVAVGPGDRLFVSVGFTVVEIGDDGSPRGRFELTSAAGCLAATAERLYLGCGDHIEVIDLADGTRTAWPSPAEGAFLTAVAVGQDVVIAGDAALRRFHRWRRDGTSLTPVVPDTATPIADATAGVPGTYYDIAAAPDGTFWATEAGAFGLVHLDAEGRRLGRFGKGSPAVEDFGGCCNPTHVASAPGNLLVTVEKKPDLVKAYRDDGQFVSVVAGPKAFQPKTFIADVAADSRGRILLVDPKAKSVRVFEPKPAEP